MGIKKEKLVELGVYCREGGREGLLCYICPLWRERPTDIPRVM